MPVIPGLLESFEDIKAVYSCLAGEEAAGGRCGLFIGEHTHSFSGEVVVEIARFFCLHAGLPLPQDSIAGPMNAVGTPTGGGQVFAPELFSADGDVATVPGFISIPTRIAEAATQRATERPPLSPTALRAQLHELLGLPQRLAGPYYRNLKPRPDVGAGTYGRCAVETEDGIEAILLKDVVAERPSRINRSLDVEEAAAVLLVPDLSASAELCLVDRVAADEAVYAVDLRGVGASLAGPVGPDGYGAEYQIHAHHLMLGESLLGKRVFDLLQVMQLLRAEATTPGFTLRLVGRGNGALVAAFAALLDTGDVSVDLIHAPLSCASWAEEALCTWPAGSVLRGMLQHFDLPDLYNALGPGRLRIFDPWTAQMSAVPDAVGECARRGVQAGLLHPSVAAAAKL